MVTCYTLRTLKKGYINFMEMQVTDTRRRARPDIVYILLLFIIIKGKDFYIPMSVCLSKVLAIIKTRDVSFSIQNSAFLVAMPTVSKICVWRLLGAVLSSVISDFEPQKHKLFNFKFFIVLVPRS